MSERKWTPGPWLVDDGSIAARCCYQEIIYVKTGTRTYDCTFIAGNLSNREADAHLIAAAPDMAGITELVASLPIRDHLGDDVPVTGADGVYITQGDVRKARAIMAKARGE